MEYIVLDMEWNQPWPGSYAAQRVLPIHISGEVIQIGAVRMLEDQTIADEFQVLIKPKFFRRLNSRVAKLTGIRESQLKAEGLSFDEAINEFYNWCGDDCV
ncbi:MAG: DNA polymerase III, partial [Oscillospiraceae bacterium]|nr:DNA polymerase III [Oscillospiraceae bacterium]